MKKRKPLPLRSLQYRGQLDIDKRFVPLADAAERIVLDRCPPDVKGRRRVTILARATIPMAIEALLIAAEPDVARTVYGRVVEAERVGAEDGDGQL